MLKFMMPYKIGGRLRRNRLSFDIGGGNAYGSLVEDVHLEAPLPSNSNMVDANTDANTMRRVQIYPVAKDLGERFFAAVEGGSLEQVLALYDTSFFVSHSRDD